MKKKQNKTSEISKKWTKWNEGNLPDTELKTIAIRMLKELSEKFNSIKKDKETKKELVRNEEYIRRINSRLDIAQNQVSNLEDKVAENTQLESEKKKEF